MPRNPAGTPAARNLIDQLAARGVTTATPRQIERCWQSGLGPKVTGNGPPDPATVDHYAALLPMIGQGRDSNIAVLTMALGGYVFDDDTVRQAILKLLDVGDLPTRDPVDTDAGFETVEAYVSDAERANHHHWIVANTRQALGEQGAHALLTSAAHALTDGKFIAPDLLLKLLPSPFESDYTDDNDDDKWFSADVRTVEDLDYSRAGIRRYIEATPVPDILARTQASFEFAAGMHVLSHGECQTAIRQGHRIQRRCVDDVHRAAFMLAAVASMNPELEKSLDAAIALGDRGRNVEVHENPSAELGNTQPKRKQR